MEPEWQVIAFEAGEPSHEVYVCYKCGRVEGKIGQKCETRVEASETPDRNQCPKFIAEQGNPQEIKKKDPIAA